MFTSYFYRNFIVKKRNGGFREISEPLPSLKEIQIWILENILYEIPVSKFAKAYIKGRNLLENAKYHKAQDFLICLDIEHFFPSIAVDKVEEIFGAMGYSSNLSNLFSKLCCCNGSLPQGSPSSPYLSNIYMAKFDSEISKYCVQNNIRYNRYADDISLSFSKKLNTDELIIYIRSELTRYNLKLNESKTKIMKPNNRQIVTGIVVNEKIQVPRYKRKEVRQEIYYLLKYGLASHLKHTGNNKANYLSHLLGKINYVLHINPMDREMQSYKDEIYKIRR